MSLNAKLAAIAVIVSAATAYLAYLGATATWRYYVLVDECAENPQTLVGHRLRVNGRIAPQTLNIRGDRQWATFSLQGQRAAIEVSCPGPLPDNLAEDMDVVVEGNLEPGDVLRIRGEKVLTRCASKYQAQQDSS